MVKERVVLERPERFAGSHVIPREKLEKAARLATDKLKRLAEEKGLGFPGN